MLKRFIAIAIFLTSCSSVDFPSPISITETQRTRYPRYCFTNSSNEQFCYRTQSLCLEGQFEEVYYRHNQIITHCDLMMVGRDKVPYCDQ